MFYSGNSQKNVASYVGSIDEKISLSDMQLLGKLDRYLFLLF